MSATGNAGDRRVDEVVSFMAAAAARFDEGAFGLALQAYAGALGVLEQLLAHNPNDTQLLDLLVRAHRGVVHARSGRAVASVVPPWGESLVGDERADSARARQEDWDHAALAEESMLAALVRLVAADPGNREWQRHLLGTYSTIARTRRGREDLGGALEAYQAAVDALLRITAAQPTDVEFQLDLAYAHSEVASFFLEAADEQTRGLEACAAALKVLLRLAAGAPEDLGLQERLAAAHQLEARLRRRSKDLLGSLAAADKALAIRSRRADDLDPQADAATFSRSLARLKESVRLLIDTCAQIAEERGRCAEIAPTLGTIRAVLGRVADATVQWPKEGEEFVRAAWQSVVELHDDLGEVFASQGDNASALRMHESAVRLRERWFESSSPEKRKYHFAPHCENFSLRRKLGEQWAQLGDPDAARVNYRAAAAIMVELVARVPADNLWMKRRSIYGKSFAPPLVSEFVECADAMLALGDLEIALLAYQSAMTVFAAVDRNAEDEVDFRAVIEHCLATMAAIGERRR